MRNIQYQVSAPGAVTQRPGLTAGALGRPYNNASLSLSLSPPTPQARNLAFILHSRGLAPMLNGVEMIIVLFIPAPLWRQQET